MKYCTICGAQLEDDARFCAECGAPCADQEPMENANHETALLRSTPQALSSYSNSSDIDVSAQLLSPERSDSSVI